MIKNKLNKDYHYEYQLIVIQLMEQLKLKTCLIYRKVGIL